MPPASARPKGGRCHVRSLRSKSVRPRLEELLDAFDRIRDLGLSLVYDLGTGDLRYCLCKPLFTDLHRPTVRRVYEWSARVSPGGGRRYGPAVSGDVERVFHQAMVRIYEVAKRDAGYNATRFLQMISERGGLDAARQLLHASTVSEGFTALWLANRLDLSVEAHVLKPEFGDLFTDEEQAIARRRLNEYGYGG